MNKYDYSENKYCECGKLITNKSKKNYIKAYNLYFI